MLYVFIKLHPICFESLSLSAPHTHKYTLNSHCNPVVTLTGHKHTHFNVSSSFSKCWIEKKILSRYSTVSCGERERVRNLCETKYIYFVHRLWQYAMSTEWEERSKPCERAMERVGMGRGVEGGGRGVKRQTNAQRINIDLSFWWKTNLKLLLLTF